MQEISQDRFNELAQKAHRIVLEDSEGKVLAEKHGPSRLYFAPPEQRKCKCGQDTQNESGYCSIDCVEARAQKRIGFHV